MDDKMNSGQIWMNVDKWCVTIFIYNELRYDSWMKTIYCSFLCTSVVIKELFWDGNILLVALEALALNMLVTIAVVHIRNLKMVWCFFYVVMHAGLGWYLCSESWDLAETTGHMSQCQPDFISECKVWLLRWITCLQQLGIAFICPSLCCSNM